MSAWAIHAPDTALEDSLRDRAVRNGRSVEAEAHAILAGALQQHPDTSNRAEAIRRRVAPFGGVDLDPRPPVTPAAPKLAR